MIKAAYDAHRLLMFLYVLFRSSLDRFDPSAWADGVEVAMIGRRVRCEPVENLDQNQLEDFQITLEGATAILDSLIWNVAGKPRSSLRMWKRHTAPLFSKWLSALKTEEILGATETTPEDSSVGPQPPTLAEAGETLSDALRELHTVFGLLGREETWVEDVTLDAFGMDPRLFDWAVNFGPDARRLILKVGAAAKLCQAVLKQLHSFG
ncbi:MAG: hypothetical protein ACLPGW_14225 [Roseiarcus sp.]